MNDPPNDSESLLTWTCWTNDQAAGFYTLGVRTGWFCLKITVFYLPQQSVSLKTPSAFKLTDVQMQS